MSHIGDVAHIPDFITQMHQGPVEHIKGDGLACMAQVSISVNGGTAGVETNKGWIKGFEDLLFPGKGVVNVEFAGHNAKLVKFSYYLKSNIMAKKKHKRGDTFTREQATALIIGLFGRNPKKIMNYKQVSSQLFIKDKYKRGVINHAMDELVRTKQLELVEPGRFRLLSRAMYKTGTLDMTQHGYAFLVIEDEKDDVFIARNNLKTGLDGDLVKVFVYPKAQAEHTD